MKNLYQCEVCETVWSTEAAAKKCESYILPPPKFHVGQDVWFKTRYDGPDHDIITGVVVAPSYCHNADRPTEKEFFEILDKVGTDWWHPHVTVYSFHNEHQLGKDWWTHRIDESSLRATKEALDLSY